MKNSSESSGSGKDCACIMGCFDTKSQFLYNVADRFVYHGFHVVCLDVGSKSFSKVTRFEHIHALNSTEKDEFENQSVTPREYLEKKASECLRSFLRESAGKPLLKYVAGAGGANGTTLVTKCFEIVQSHEKCKGVKFCCVSTIALHMDPAVQQYLVPALTDIIGTNPILEGTAKYSVDWLLGKSPALHEELYFGLDSADEWLEKALQFLKQLVDMENIQTTQSNKVVGITMFGLTTPCVEKCVELLLAEGLIPMVFHAVGLSGGRIMGELVKSGFIGGGVLDLTTTEMADELFGGVLNAPMDRFLTIARSGLPCVFAPGAIDIINYLEDKVPTERKENKAKNWSPFTLSRSSGSDNAKLAECFAAIVNVAKSEISAVAIPKTFSGLSEKDAEFYDPGADAFFVKRFSEQVKPEAKVLYSELNINDERFAAVVFTEFLNLRSSLRSHSKPVWEDSLNEITYPCHEKRSQRILDLLRKARRPLIAVGAGSGLVAQAASAGGADLIVVYNSGFFRSQGYGSLAGMMPFGNANDIAFDIGSHVLAAVMTKKENCPVIVGLCAQDPLFEVKKMLRHAEELGFSGVINFPTVGLIDSDSQYRRSLHETGFGYDKEVDMISRAVQMGLFSISYVFTEQEAVDMVSVGAHAIVIHLGLTTSNLGGRSSQFTLETAGSHVTNICARVKEINSECLILVHGGPLNSSKDYEKLSSLTLIKVDGFVGASTFERSPVHTAVNKAVERFKNL